MSAPSAGNRQPWHFMVITEREILNRVPDINSHAAMAREAPAAILVCGDLNLKYYPGSWVLDCSAAVQNLLLAAHAMGMGAVWTGIYPRRERIEGFRRLMGLPEHIVPLAFVPLGYPAQELPRENRYKEERVHYNRW